MVILQGILVLGLIIGFFVGVYHLWDKFLDLILDKKGDKLETITTIDGGKWLIDQLCSGIRSMCDSIQDDNNFASYPSKYIMWKTDILNYNIRNILRYIKQKRQQFLPIAYEFILQTSKPLEHITSLDENIIYRIIVLKKYNKENEPMDEKQQILNDIKEAQRKLDQARKKLNKYNEGDKRWNVKHGDDFYFVSSDGDVVSECFDDSSDIDCGRYNFYNCFKTRKEAEVEVEKMFVRRKLEDIAKRLNKGKKPDWHNASQRKYYIQYTGYEGKVEGNYTYTYKIAGATYCLGESFFKVAKYEIGEKRLIKYLKGEG